LKSPNFAENGPLFGFFATFALSVTEHNLQKFMQKINPPMRLAMFASGSGTNVANFIGYFNDHPLVHIALVISNNPGAYVLQRAREAGIPSAVILRKQWGDEDVVMGILLEHQIDAIVLAGFLLLVPAYLVQRFEGRIINIHPALLPHFGGKGMYGAHVHEAVVASGNKESGITIHLVNEAYDSGDILFQAKVKLDPDETPDSLATKIHALEYEHFPVVVERYFRNHVISNR
jgi:phosphoribosylglycinamide formyltransferase 1